MRVLGLLFLEARNELRSRCVARSLVGFELELQFIQLVRVRSFLLAVKVVHLLFHGRDAFMQSADFAERPILDAIFPTDFFQQGRADAKVQRGDLQRTFEMRLQHGERNVSRRIRDHPTWWNALR